MKFLHTILTEDAEGKEWRIPFLKEEFFCDGCKKIIHHSPKLIGYINSPSVFRKIEYCGQCIIDGIKIK